MRPPLRPLLARGLPFAIYITFLVIASSLPALPPGSELIPGLPVDLRWLYAVQIALVIGALVFYRHEYLELAAPSSSLSDLSPSSGQISRSGKN
jgi:hypothetical protein